MTFSMRFIVKHHKAGVFESYEKSTAAASFSMRIYRLNPTCFSNADNRTDSFFSHMEGQNNNIFVPFLQSSEKKQTGKALNPGICHFKAILCSFPTLNFFVLTSFL